jgi:hypothetical protein
MSFFLKFAPASALAISLGLSLNGGCIASTADTDAVGFAAQAITCVTVSDGQETLPNRHCGGNADAGTANAAAAAPSPPSAGSLLGGFDTPYASYGSGYYGGYYGGPFGGYYGGTSGYYGGLGNGFGGYGYSYGSPLDGYGFGAYGLLGGYGDSYGYGTSTLGAAPLGNCGCGGGGGGGGGSG